MAARIFHFGGDGCNRLAVLQLAGYQVDNCDSLPDLLAALIDDQPADAVVITELTGDPEEVVVETAREHCHAPIILFQSPDCHCLVADFDLVIPTLTPPRWWLDKIAAMIEHSKAIRAERRALVEDSARLRLESAVLRHRSARERARSRSSLDRKPPPIAPGD